MFMRREDVETFLFEVEQKKSFINLKKKLHFPHFKRFELDCSSKHEMISIEKMRTWMAKYRESQKSKVDWSDAGSIECYEWIMGLMEADLDDNPENFHEWHYMKLKKKDAFFERGMRSNRKKRRFA